MIKALIVLKEGKKTTEEEIIRFCKDRLAGFKSPKTMAVVDDLPKTALGKVDKQVLRGKR